MNIPSELKYTKDHEWIRIENGYGYIGITDFAQKELGDIVFVEIETVGEHLQAEEVFGTVEAVKTVSDLFLPVTAEIVELNQAIIETPELVNQDPYGKGWMIKVLIHEPKALDELLTAVDYKKLINA